MLENAITNITKNIQWILGQKLVENVLNLKLQILLLDSERQVCGLFYFSEMKLQLKLFKDSVIALSEDNTNCRRCQETFQTEVLSLTPEIDRQPQRR